MSYVWGPLTFDHQISCNDLRCLITQSFYELLLPLRPSQSERLLWIDQICINQDDLDKRAQQVRLMGDTCR